MIIIGAVRESGLIIIKRMTWNGLRDRFLLFARIMFFGLTEIFGLQKYGNIEMNFI